MEGAGSAGGGAGSGMGAIRVLKRRMNEIKLDSWMERRMSRKAGGRKKWREKRGEEKSERW